MCRSLSINPITSFTTMLPITVAFFNKKNKRKMTINLQSIFSQKLSSGIATNGVSRHQDFKIFWGNIPPDRPCQIPVWLGLRLDSLLNAGISLIKTLKCKIFLREHAVKASKCKLILNSSPPLTKILGATLSMSIFYPLPNPDELGINGSILPFDSAI